jgi:hypothetical protein
VYAAPFDALAYNGMQINGSMEVSQENGATSIPVIAATVNIADGWNVICNGAQINANVGNETVTPSGFTRSLRMIVGIAIGIPAAGNFGAATQKIEGYRCNRLGFGKAGASPITISFWVQTNRVGTYSGSVRNNSVTRSYAFTFSVSAVGTWEYKTITVPGDTSGTWEVTNLTGLEVSFTMFSGSTFTTAPNVWTAGNFIGATGTINGANATTDFMLLTGVVVLPGIEAPSAARSVLIMRPYDQELLTCQRYYQITQVGTGICVATNVARLVIPYMVPVRNAPTAAVIVGPLGITDTLQNVMQSAAQITNISPARNYMQADFAGFTGLTVGKFCYCLPLSGSGFISLDARL